MAYLPYTEQLSGNLTVAASAFETLYTPQPQSLMIFINGNHQSLYQDYVIANNDILFTTMIPSGWDVRASYQYNTDLPTCSARMTLVASTETFTVTASAGQTVFTLAEEPYPYSYFIFLNGNVERDTIDYNIDGTTLTFVSAVPSGWIVDASYDYAVIPDPVVPTGSRGSTTLNPVVTSFELLADRIKIQLGYPVVNIELCDDQIYDFINRGCEWYSKYAGQTEEYFIFSSDQYTSGYGIKMDDVINRITDYQGYGDTISPLVTSQFYDCDTNNYRKVAGVFSLDPAGGGMGGGSNSAVLFNMDYMFAQQAYFGQMMGGMGYDLITWHLLKSWLDDRKKLFATEMYVRFDPRSQVMKLIPEPGARGTFTGVIGVRLERSVADLVQERWVQMYAMALTKQALAHIRGKFGAVTLFGGASIQASDLMTQGMAEQTKLEEELMNGYGESIPPFFLIA